MTDSKRRSAGSVRQNKSGTFSLRFNDPDGIRQSRGPYLTRKEADAALSEILTDIRRGEYFDTTKGDVKLSQFFTEYMTKREGEGLSAGTLRNYRSLFKTMLAPTFGNKRLNTITVRQVDLWWARQGKHPVNRRNGYFLLSSVMRTAVRWGYIKQSPCMVENAGKDVAATRPTWTMDDFRSVAKHLEEDMQTVAWLILCAHLRVSEMAGLNMGDFDPKTGVLTVERQDSEIGKRHLKATKTTAHVAVWSGLARTHSLPRLPSDSCRRVVACSMLRRRWLAFRAGQSESRFQYLALHHGTRAAT